MSHSNFTRTSQPDDAPLDAKVLDALGRALSAHYDEVIRAPLPDRFLDLLEELDRKERRAGLSGGADASTR